MRHLRSVRGTYHMTLTIRPKSVERTITFRGVRNDPRPQFSYFSIQPPHEHEHDPLIATRAKRVSRLLSSIVVQFHLLAMMMTMTTTTTTTTMTMTMTMTTMTMTMTTTMTMTMTTTMTMMMMMMTTTTMTMTMMTMATPSANTFKAFDPSE